MIVEINMTIKFEVDDEIIYSEEVSRDVIKNGMEPVGAKYEVFIDGELVEQEEDTNEIYELIRKKIEAG